MTDRVMRILGNCAVLSGLRRLPLRTIAHSRLSYLTTLLASFIAKSPAEIKRTIRYERSENGRANVARLFLRFEFLAQPTEYVPRSAVGRRMFSKLIVQNETSLKKFWTTFSRQRYLVAALLCHFTQISAFNVWKEVRPRVQPVCFLVLCNHTREPRRCGTGRGLFSSTFGKSGRHADT